MKVVQVDVDTMTFDDGMKEFKAGNYNRASEQFVAVTEADENNHKAWNALGICLSKTGKYEDAGLCFGNAVALAPDNATYKKNQAGNAAKITEEPDLNLEDEPVRKIPVAPPATGASGLWTLIKIGGGIFVFLIFCMVVAAFVFGMSGGSTHKQVSTPSLSNNVQAAQVTTIVTTIPVVEQTPDKVSAGEKNAAKKAKTYLEFMAFSRDGLVHQLEFDKFTHADAEYGADQSGADWNEQAAKKAKSYIDAMSFSRDGLIKQLVFDKFTTQQAEYGVKAVGY